MASTRRDSPPTPSSRTASSSIADPDAIQKATTNHLENAAINPRWTPGYGPLSQIPSNESYLPAFGGAFQPGLYKPPDRKLANPAPLGLSGFALTTFILSLLNLGTRGSLEPNIIVGPALAYGGLIQLLAGMWEMAVGNTFGATALSSYGGFWIGLGIIFTPGGFNIAAAYGGATPEFYAAVGFYLYGWFIFTFILWLLTLRSTLAFSSLFFTVWLTFLMLATGYMYTTTTAGVTSPHATLVKAGGGFGIVAAFIAWWNMLAGIADRGNSFFLVPVAHFPWSEKGRQRKRDRQNSVDEVEKMA
ncbi:hypothetical protein D6D21_10501 [Aureobasidium pullulans]|uniref:GPR/FUN34 family protein-like protein n=1 Tax=Aureobasidium pullulans TaxID=5580 RepID=A0A4S9AUM0_AURPU|nr:hypothetical protein D6D21_10501 [Aureobasidium pullulans]THW83778.1 hypothetical protein D6D15_09343 [Aureobasidium pullulans]